MTTQIKETEKLSVEFNIGMNFYAIDGEKLSIEFKNFNKVREDISDAKIGEYVGTIDILYPVADLKVAITIEVYHGFNRGIYEEFEAECGVFKLPFVNEPMSIVGLEYELFSRISEFDEIEETYESYERCTCGGYWMPMYEEFPNWIKFCNRCDARTEDFEGSPLPY